MRRYYQFIRRETYRVSHLIFLFKVQIRWIHRSEALCTSTSLDHSATPSGRAGYFPGVILAITRATTVRPHGEYLSRMVSVARINARKSMPRSENTPASMFVRHSGSPTPPPHKNHDYALYPPRLQLTFRRMQQQQAPNLWDTDPSLTLTRMFCFRFVNTMPPRMKPNETPTEFASSRIIPCG